MGLSKETKMGEAPIVRLMITLSLPSIIAQVINILYNIVDRIFIGHIEGVGATALTGVGLTFPILMLVTAFSTFSSQGGAALAAMELGKGDRKKAEKILGSCVWLLILFSIFLMAVFYVFHVPFLYIFGASNETIPYASSYLNIYLAGTIFVEMALGLNSYIIVQGRSGIAMCSILVGALVNVILDPLFIFGFGLGVRGAAAATVISQFISALWNILFLCGKKSTLKIRKKYIRCDTKVVGRILALGISPFVMKSTECLIQIVMNRQLQIFGGDLYVGTMTIMQSVMQLMYAPITGFTQGVSPMISYNFGAQKFDRVKKTYRIMILTCLVFGFCSTATEVLFPKFYGGLFTSDTQLIALIGQVMPVFVCGMLVFGAQDGIQSTFLALGQAKISLFVAMLRKVILLVPLALILPHFFGIMGVYYAEPVSDILSVSTAAVLFTITVRRLLSKKMVDQLT